MAPHIDVRSSAEGFYELAHALDLRSSLAAAEASIRSALERAGSHGAHQRSDHPQLDPTLGVNIVVKGAEGEMAVSRSSPAAVPDYPARWATAGADVAAEGRLLE